LAGLIPATADIDDYFEVRIGGKDGTVADNLSYDTTGTPTLTVSDIDKDIEGETEVSVTFKEKLTAANPALDTAANVYVLTLDKVNG
jgi:hypothetical protein